MKLAIVPIEPMEERYSSQWIRWFDTQLKELKVDFQFVIPKGTPKNNVITQGEFLDVTGTNIFKAKQLQQLCEMAQQGALTPDTVLLFHDLWFPGLEMLGYIRDALGLKFKIAGMLHAGTWDPHDFITQKGMGTWGKSVELGWIMLADKIFVATQFHKDLINQYFLGTTHPLKDKIIVTDFPLFVDEHELGENFSESGYFDHKVDTLVVFPHRLAPEKQPEYFDTLIGYAQARSASNDLTFLRTRDVCETKADYYRLLTESQFAVSFAKQETWGIAMQEAVLCGCVPIVPDKLSYAELYPTIFKYNTNFSHPVSALLKIEQFRNLPREELETSVKDLARAFRIRGATAIPKILAQLVYLVPG